MKAGTNIRIIVYYLCIENIINYVRDIISG